VIDINPETNTAMKCTLCYDRLQAGMVPACAQACPTQSIQFGPIDELKQRAQQRLEQLHAQGVTQARLYGHDESILGGLNSFYLLLDEPETYGLPKNPKLPSTNTPVAAGLSTASAVVLGLLGLVSLRKRRMEELASAAREPESDE
jgi:formate dehydrogenase iron-sulfur subunit